MAPRKKTPVKRKVTLNNKRQKGTTVGTLEKVARVAQNSSLLSRSMLSNRLGVQFDGQRDLYETFGYVRFPDFTDYMNLYERHGLAQRVVRKFADSTWNKTPVLIDGESRSDSLDKDATPFLKEWDSLVKRLGVTQVMRQADIMCQIGQYSVFFLGASGNDFSKPIKKSDGLFYVAAYDESQAIIQSLIADTKSERFGMPETYSITFNSIDIGLQVPGGNLVHHSRIIHLAEDRLGSRIYGTPRLKACLNRLFDLEKTTGGGAEAAWLATWGGMLFTASEDAEIPEETSEEGRYLDEQMQKFFHRMQRYAILKGVETTNLGVQNVDIGGIYTTLKTDLAGTVGIPQRILFGSERGELASTQDQSEWNSVIDTRRTNFAEPEMLRPFINRCIEYGFLPPPTVKDYGVEWYPVYPMTKADQAAYGQSLAAGASTITGGVPESAMDIKEWRAVSGLPPREENVEEDSDSTDDIADFIRKKSGNSEFEEFPPNEEVSDSGNSSQPTLENVNTPLLNRRNGN